MSAGRSLDGVTIVTPTGGRPAAFALCQEYVGRFRRDGRPLQWIVVDDCDPPTTEGLYLEGALATVIRPTPPWRPGQNTLARNLLAAVSEVAYDKIVFVEDDDAYGPDYLRAAAERLDYYDLVGEPHARYYHVGRRMYRIMPNASYASLCQTAMRRRLLPLFEDVCRESPRMIDVRLWAAASNFSKRLYDSSGCVGIKGLPGRPGIGIGHRPEPGDWKLDVGGLVLRSWIGTDADRYERRPALRLM